MRIFLKWTDFRFNKQISTTMHDLHIWYKLQPLKFTFPFSNETTFSLRAFFLSLPYKRIVKPCSSNKLVLWRSWINIMRRLSYFFMVSQFLTWQNKLIQDENTCVSPFNWPLKYLSNKNMVFNFPYLYCLLTWFDLNCKFNMLDPFGRYFLNTSCTVFLLLHTKQKTWLII